MQDQAPHGESEYDTSGLSLDLVSTRTRRRTNTHALATSHTHGRRNGRRPGHDDRGPTAPGGGGDGRPGHDRGGPAAPGGAVDSALRAAVHGDGGRGKRADAQPAVGEAARPHLRGHLRGRQRGVPCAHLHPARHHPRPERPDAAPPHQAGHKNVREGRLRRAHRPPRPSGHVPERAKVVRHALRGCARQLGRVCVGDPARGGGQRTGAQLQLVPPLQRYRADRPALGGRGRRARVHRPPHRRGSRPQHRDHDRARAAACW